MVSSLPRFYNNSRWKAHDIFVFVVVVVVVVVGSVDAWSSQYW